MTSTAEGHTVGETSGTVYGKDCPKGSVQIEWVGVDPSLRMGDYGWRPTDARRVMLDVWVDGLRYSIQVGTFNDGNGDKRGLHVVTDVTDLKIERTAMNSLSLWLGDEPRLRADGEKL